MKKRKAYMATQFQTREEQESGDLILSGYFIKFDEETELWPGYFEVIKREGVEKAIRNADIRALFNHDHSLVGLEMTQCGSMLMMLAYLVTSSLTKMTHKRSVLMLVFNVET